MANGLGLGVATRSVTRFWYEAVRLGDGGIRANVSGAVGGYAEMATDRAQWVVLYGVDATPTSAWCDGAQLHQTTPGQAPGWWTATPADAEAMPVLDDNTIVVSARSLVLACGRAPTTAARQIGAAWK